MDVLYYIAIILLVVGVPTASILIVLGLIKPLKLKKILHLKTVPHRKRILKWGIIGMIVAMIILVTVLIFTEPDSVRQQTAARQAQQLKVEQQNQREQSAFAESQQLAAEQTKIKQDQEAAAPKTTSELKTKAIAYKTIRKKTSTLLSGDEQVLTEGVEGERTTTFEVTTENGIETSREQLSSEVTIKPITKVILVGTYNKSKAKLVSTKIIKGIGEKCLDVKYGRANSQAAVQLYSCNATKAQKWGVYSDDTVRNGDFCLGLRWGDRATKTKTWLYDCNGAATQKWKLLKNNTIVNRATALCLDSQWGSMKNETPIWLYDCNKTKAQLWRQASAVAKKKVTNAVKPVTPRSTNITPKYVAPKPTVKKKTPVIKHNTATGVTKMSSSGICHTPGSRYYSRTTNFTAYKTLQSCLSAGGRLPKQ